MSQVNVAIVNYQAGNLRSVQKALEQFGARALITSNVKDIKEADALVFPGQGASDSSMTQLRESNLIEPLVEYIGSGKPFLGVCLALQLLLEESEEGKEPGLGIIEGKVRKLPSGVKVPHMGWNSISITKPIPIIKNLDQINNFYLIMGVIVDIFLPLSLAFIMFALGLGLTGNDFLRVVKQPRDFFVGAYLKLFYFQLLLL